MDFARSCVQAETVYMKAFFITAVALGVAAIGHAQQKHTDTTKVKFTPPVIINDGQTTTKRDEVVKFTPPVIVKDQPAGSKRQKSKPVRFTPPVIVKDKED